MSFSLWLRNRTSTRPPRGRAQHRPAAPRFRPRLEALEGRWMPSTLTVMNNLDSGPGSLRADIAAANSGDKIVFAPSLNGQTITLTSGELAISKNLTIQGPGASHLTISGDHLSRVFDVNAPVVAPVVLSDLTISNGNSNSSLGGGILNASTLTVSHCTISNNHAGFWGGGIANERWLTVSDCTISNNSCGLYGGGIYNTLGGRLTVSQCTLNRDSADRGGAIYNTLAGTLTVSQCTLSRDSARGGGGGIYNTPAGTLTVSDSTLSYDTGGPFGGGIYTYSGFTTLTNCTLSNNRAVRGGGLYVWSVHTTTLTNCTLSLNSAASGGGIYVGNYSLTPLYLFNTIVAGNTASTPVTPGPDIYGYVSGADHNLVGDASGSTGIFNGSGGNIVGGNGNPVIDAHLGPLQNNGGPTQTMALLAGSPAISHADSSKAPAKDQRGLLRMDEPGETTDIGAFEL
jgi:hypothetical protein